MESLPFDTLDVSQHMKSDDPRHTANNFNQTNSSSNNQNNVGKDGKYNTIRSCGDNIY